MVYLHAGFLVAVYAKSDSDTELRRADPDKKSKIVLKRLAKAGLLFELEMEFDMLSTARDVDPNWIPEQVSPEQVEALVSARLEQMGRKGRGAAISQGVALKVWADAGARCMFEGCAEDLSTVNLYNDAARIGYLAHIIASDPRGPRGDVRRSHDLSNRPDNIMLMCDAHHRTIDSFAPERYSAERLFAMREAHVQHVRRCLESLSYPRVDVGTLFADLANAPTRFVDSELNDALLATGRAMTPGGVVHYIRHVQRDDRRRPNFWVEYLHEHEQDIRRLLASFRKQESASPRKIEVAIFPLHHIATLVLAGRIIGEAHAVYVYQYHRERRTWQWEEAATPQPKGFFSVDGLSNTRASDVLVSLEVTAQLDEQALPTLLRESTSNASTPWVRIRAAAPSGSCIRHPDDLDHFMAVARQAINHVQDVMRAERVHLIAISPASTVFCFGQMLQAGHHPAYMVYDRSDRESPFAPAFSITGTAVTARAGEESYSIQLR